jgi:hypothetical protein
MENLDLMFSDFIIGLVVIAITFRVGLRLLHLLLQAVRAAVNIVGIIGLLLVVYLLLVSA